MGFNITNNADKVDIDLKGLEFRKNYTSESKEVHSKVSVFPLGWVR